MVPTVIATISVLLTLAGFLDFGCDCECDLENDVWLLECDIVFECDLECDLWLLECDFDLEGDL